MAEAVSRLCRIMIDHEGVVRRAGIELSRRIIAGDPDEGGSDE
jgi:hypothetical protein